MVDMRRLKMEQQEVQSRLQLLTFILRTDMSFHPDDWRHYVWAGFSFTGHRILLRYPQGYPYHPFDVQVQPDVQTGHKYPGNRLCYMLNMEWNPSYTAATIIPSIFRFLHDYQKGRI